MSIQRHGDLECIKMTSADHQKYCINLIPPLAEQGCQTDAEQSLSKCSRGTHNNQGFSSSIAEWTAQDSYQYFVCSCVNNNVF